MVDGSLLGLDYEDGERPKTLPSRGLIVRNPWATLLLDGSKTWELRGSSTAHRGRTGLILSGSKQVLGEADLVRVVGPLDTEELVTYAARHLVAEETIRKGLTYRKVFAWEFENPKPYPVPKPYRHPHGAVIWVDLHAHGL